MKLPLLHCKCKWESVVAARCGPLLNRLCDRQGALRAPHFPAGGQSLFPEGEKAAPA